MFDVNSGGTIYKVEVQGVNQPDPPFLEVLDSQKSATHHSWVLATRSLEVSCVALEVASKLGDSQNSRRLFVDLLITWSAPYTGSLAR